MRVKQLVLHNFRSYSDITVDKLDSNCTIIVGRNGQGKSNLHIALMFLFSDTHQGGGMQIRRDLMSEAKGADGEFYVEGLVTDMQGRLPEKDGDTLIRKSIDKEGNIHITINDRTYKEDEYYNMMEVLGISRHNPLNFMLQGKVKRVAQTDEKGLFSMLADVVGTSQYEERRGESLGMMESVALDEKKANDLLEDFREKLNELEVDKEDYSKYEDNLKAGNR